MSYLSVQGEASTTSEIVLLTNLTNLAISPAGQFIRKTGATTFENATPTSGLNFADNEIPTGAINGSNVTFTLANTPSPVGSLIFVVNGQVLLPGGVDMTLSGLTVTTVTAPPTNSTMRCWYRY